MASDEFLSKASSCPGLSGGVFQLCGNYESMNLEKEEKVFHEIKDQHNFTTSSIPYLSLKSLYPLVNYIVEKFPVERAYLSRGTLGLQHGPKSPVKPQFPPQNGRVCLPAVRSYTDVSFSDQILAGMKSL